MQIILAPIVVSVYTRMSHFCRCIEALKLNDLADQSDLFVYSDAPGKQEDAALVQLIRNFAKNISGFKSVIVVERDVNQGGVKNALSGQREITRKYGKSIFLEDDIVTAPGFLRFMNEAFKYYESDKRIMSITGYCPPLDIDLMNVDGDVFLLPRYCGWGAGVWKNRLEMFHEALDKDEFSKIRNKSRLFSAGGADVIKMIKKEIAGKIDAQDVRNMYQQAIRGQYTIYPVRSLVQNIGHDGSGMHCPTDRRFQHNELWGKMADFRFIDNIQLDDTIVRKNYIFRGGGLRGKIHSVARKIGVNNFLKC